MSKIEITKETEDPNCGYFVVKIGDRNTGPLTWDEMLGTITLATLGLPVKYQLLTDEQWVDYNKRFTNRTEIA